MLPVIPACLPKGLVTNDEVVCSMRKTDNFKAASPQRLPNRVKYALNAQLGPMLKGNHLRNKYLLNR